MRKWLLIAVAAVGLLLVAIVVTGYLLPVDHVASRTVVVAGRPERVFQAIAHVHEYPSWRSNVKAVDLLGSRRWVERSGDGDIIFEEVESRPPRRRVTRIADDTLPFGGTWTFELAPEDSGTRVTITEHGKVFNPVFRFMSRFVFGHTTTIDGFLDDLKKHATRRLGPPTVSS